MNTGLLHLQQPIRFFIRFKGQSLKIQGAAAFSLELLKLLLLKLAVTEKQLQFLTKPHHLHPP